MTRYWYALELAPVPGWTLLFPARVHRFTSRAARDHWTCEEASYSGRRYTVRSGHKAVRWANRTDAWGTGVSWWNEAVLPATLVARW